MILRSTWVGAFFVGALACSGGSSAVAPEARPGGPAYWESNVPAEPKRADAGATPAGMHPEGTTDKFLWEDPGARRPTTTPPEAQTPLRTPEAIDNPIEKMDGGADAAPQ